MASPAATTSHSMDNENVEEEELCRQLIVSNLSVLQQLREALMKMSDSDYISKAYDDTSPLGMHVRHIVEFHEELFKTLMNMADNEVCYDRRARNLDYENSRQMGIEAIQSLELLWGNNFYAASEPVMMSVTLDVDKDPMAMHSCVYREMAYVLDHTIHHMEIIRLIARAQGIVIHAPFGVAISTQRYQKNLEQ